MESEDLLRRFDELSIWKKGGQRAPHKPLLVLYALGLWQRGRAEVSFREAEPPLRALLQEFGPPRKSDHPEQPFWRLQNDGVWSVRAPALPLKTGDTIPRVGELRSPEVRAGFTDEVRSALDSDPGLVTRIAERILDRNFPESLHQDILSAVGLNLEREVVSRRKRDPEFRQRVLKAYEYRCAVCGFDVRLRSLSIALDAAHIRWHQAGGPDDETNGLALCVLHHKTFDLGAFTIAQGHILISDEASGTSGFHETLMAHHGSLIRMPQRPEWSPKIDHLTWHRREVFKGDPRHIAS